MLPGIRTDRNHSLAANTKKQIEHRRLTGMVWPGWAAIRCQAIEFQKEQSRPNAWLAHKHVHPHYLVIIGILTCRDAVAARKINRGTNATVVEIIAFRTKMYLSQRICEFRQI